MTSLSNKWRHKTQNLFIKIQKFTKIEWQSSLELRLSTNSVYNEFSPPVFERWLCILSFLFILIVLFLPNFYKCRGLNQNEQSFIKLQKLKVFFKRPIFHFPIFSFVFPYSTPLCVFLQRPYSLWLHPALCRTFEQF